MFNSGCKARLIQNGEEFKPTGIHNEHELSTHNLSLDNRRWKSSEIEDPEINETGPPQKKAKITN